jgi:chromosome segregation ATPase
MAEIDIEQALGDLKSLLQPIHKVLSHVTREVRPADAAFTRLCETVRLLQAEVKRLRQLGFDHVDLLERSQAEVTRLHAENAELVSIQAREMNRADGTIQTLTASRDSFLKENGRLKKELLALCTENAELRENLRRMVKHLEYEGQQGDGIADGAWDDYHAARLILGNQGMPNAADRRLPAIRQEIPSAEPGAST